MLCERAAHLVPATPSCSLASRLDCSLPPDRGSVRAAPLADSRPLGSKHDSPTWHVSARIVAFSIVCRTVPSRIDRHSLMFSNFDYYSPSRRTNLLGVVPSPRVLASAIAPASVAVIQAPVILSPANLVVPSRRPLSSYESVTLAVPSEGNKFHCAICTHVAFAPPNLPCGHLYCRTCVERVPDARCPQCRESFSRYALPSVNMFVQREIWQLRVKCRKSSSGCPWTDAMGTTHRNIEGHERVCTYRSAKCGACQTSVMVKDVAAHPNQCHARLVRCTDCQQHMKYSEYVRHRTPPSAQLQLQEVAPCQSSRLCPHRCSTHGRITVLPTRDMDTHEKTTCTLRRLRCPQCDLDLLATALEQHREAECPRRRVKCQHCDQHMEFRSLAAHQPQPPANPDDNVPPCEGFALCINGCKDAQQRTTLLRTGAMPSHLSECPMRQTTCSDCKKDLLARALSTHQKDTCMERIVTCRHCSDQLTFRQLTKEHLHAHAKKGHAPCSSMMMCARGCKSIHRKDASAAHLDTCARRPAECPCCTPPVALPYCDVMAHVRTVLADESHRDRMAKLLVQLHKSNKQLRAEHSTVKADAKKSLAGATEKLQREKREWHDKRAKNDRIHDINRSLADEWIKEHGACRAHLMYANCNFGHECKFKHFRA